MIMAHAVRAQQWKLTAAPMSGCTTATLAAEKTAACMDATMLHARITTMSGPVSAWFMLGRDGKKSPARPLSRMHDVRDDKYFLHHITLGQATFYPLVGLMSTPQWARPIAVCSPDDSPDHDFKMLCIAVRRHYTQT